MKNQYLFYNDSGGDNGQQRQSTDTMTKRHDMDRGYGHYIMEQKHIERRSRDCRGKRARPRII
jgi:hypothetical protein